MVIHYGTALAILGQKPQPESTPSPVRPAGMKMKAETMRKMTLVKITIFAVMLAAILPAASSLAQTEMPVSYTWTAPTTGTAVEFYVIEHSVDGGQWTQIATSTENSYTLNATVGQSHQIRVAGMDANNRQGIFSVASDPYLPDAGAPGQPGKPILF